MQRPLGDKSPSQLLFNFFLIWMGCFLFANLLAVVAMVAFYGYEEVYNSLEGGMNILTSNITFVKILQIFLSLLIFALPPLIFSKLYHKKASRFFRLNKIPDFRLLGLTLLIPILAGPFIYWILEVNQNISLPDFMRGMENFLKDREEQNEMLLKSIMDMQGTFGFVLNFLMIAIVPAFVEELLFRGTLQKLFTRLFNNPHVAIIFTGFLFSIMHFLFYGLLPRMFLGILFGYLFYWSGNLWLPILAHLVHNGVQVVMVYLYQLNMVDMDIEQVETVPPLMIMISTILLFSMLFLFDLTSKQLSLKDGKGMD